MTPISIFRTVRGTTTMYNKSTAPWPWASTSTEPSLNMLAACTTVKPGLFLRIKRMTAKHSSKQRIWKSVRKEFGIVPK
eukprot:2815248-Amphidinium_carterae.1